MMDHELIDVMFGIDHIIAEFFWNGIFLLATYLFAKARTLKRVHKYIDEKHGLSHEEGY